MDGEIITTGEQMKADEHARKLDTVIKTDPKLARTLAPIRDFLDHLAWKGSH